MASAWDYVRGHRLAAFVEALAGAVAGHAVLARRSREFGEAFAMVSVKLVFALVRHCAERYGPEAATVFREQIAELRALGLVEIADGATRLTSRGRLLSNEVFAALA